jgi:hypothetical protein
VAKTKAELLKQAQDGGLVASDASEDDYTQDELSKLLHPETVKVDNEMAQEPLVAPDGHVVLSQEDIDARDK